MAVIARLAGVSTPTVSQGAQRPVRGGLGDPAAGGGGASRAWLPPTERGRRRSPASRWCSTDWESHLTVSILRGVEEVVRKQELVVGFTEVRSRAATERPWAEQLLTRRPVGVIAVHSYFTPQEHALLTASGIPLVALDPSGMPPDTVPSVGSTNWNGGVAATRHLLELGHRRIAVIGGSARSLVARARLDACRAAMDAASVPLDERLIRTGHFLFEDGCEFGRDLLDVRGAADSGHLRQRPTSARRL